VGVAVGQVGIIVILKIRMRHRPALVVAGAVDPGTVLVVRVVILKEERLHRGSMVITVEAVGGLALTQDLHQVVMGVAQVNMVNKRQHNRVTHDSEEISIPTQVQLVERMGQQYKLPTQVGASIKDYILNLI